MSMKKHFSVYLPMIIGGMLSIGHATAENYPYNQNEYPNYYENPNNRQTPYEYNYYDRNFRRDTNNEAYPRSTYRYEEPRVFTEFDDHRYMPTSQNQPNRSDAPNNVYQNKSLNQSTANYRPVLLTEEELLTQINNDSRTTYFKLDLEGKLLARQLAAQNKYTDKNQAVQEAAQQVAHQPNQNQPTYRTDEQLRSDRQGRWLKTNSSKNQQ